MSPTPLIKIFWIVTAYYAVRNDFSWLPQKLTCCERFGLQNPNSEECIFFTPERPFLGVIFGQKEFSRPNGRLSPIACHTYSESYASKAILVLLQWHAKRQLLSSFNHLKTKILEHHLDIDQAGLNIAANVLLPNDGTDGNDNVN